LFIEVILKKKNVTKDHPKFIQGKKKKTPHLQEKKKS
jgi:hypothetical protein